MPHRIPRSTVVVIAALMGIVLAITAFLALRTRRDTDTRLDQFWAWWASAAPRIAAALDAKDNRSFVEELSSRVHAIDPGLAWETGPGLKGSRHHLTVSSEGDAILRVLTQRWVARAPSPDAAWEFYPARQALPYTGSWSLRFDDTGGVELDFKQALISVTVDMGRERLDVRLYHPNFARLDEGKRKRAAFVMLDNLLGEDDVERWLARIETSNQPLPTGRPVEALISAVGELSKGAKGEAFALMQGKTPTGEPMVAMINLALKRVDHLLMDQHVAVTIPLRTPTEQGLPTTKEADELNALEDQLIDVLGRDAIYFGRETGRGLRVIHFQGAYQGPVESRTRTWAKQHTDRRVSVASEFDPKWLWFSRW
jgi:hypothetical protein